MCNLRKLTRHGMKRAYHSVRPMIPDVWDEVVMMTLRLRYRPNIRSPRSFNERIAHRKLLEYDDRYERLADKWRVREYVRERLGNQYLTVVYQFARDPEQLDFTGLPDRFVLKTTHDSGSAILVENKASVDWTRVLRRIKAQWAQSYGITSNEYWYRRIPRGVLAEEWLRDALYGVPLDFKFFVFHGRVRMIQVDHDRFGRHTRTLYDPAWNALPVGYVYPRGPRIGRPSKLHEMMSVAETLGDGFDFVRVDLYSPNDDRVVFGELTFAPEAGRGRFVPAEFDWELGRFWETPTDSSSRGRTADRLNGREQL